MATAPRPGAARAQAAATTIMRLTVQGVTHDLTINSIPLNEKMAVRLATGLPFEAFVANQQAMGEDSFAVLWWLARRANGEPRLPWATSSAEWPTGLQADDLDVTMIEPDEGDDAPQS